MAKKVAPVSLTGGAGYDFEDHVAAWFLAHLLCGEIPVDSGLGIPVAVDFQVRESGWLLDDLLITSKDSQGIERRLALSVKRDRQVTQNGFARGFVLAAWEQWLGLSREGNPFKKDHDLLGLAVGQLADSVKSAWDEISRQAIDTSAERLAKRLTTPGAANALQRALFRTLQCSTSLTRGARVCDSDTAQLLCHLRLLRFDFRSSASNDKLTAIRMCQRCLRHGSLQEANALWDDLVAIAAELRGRGGSINLSQLLSRLRRYDLEEYPDYRADWDAIEAVSSEAMAGVRTELGRGIAVSRVALVEEISGQLAASGQVVLLGESGAGKSALAKTIATGQSGQRTVWVNGRHLEGEGLSAVSRSLGISHNLMEILLAVGCKGALLVIDALEGFSPQALRNAAELMKALKEGASGSRWHVLVTAQPLCWTDVQVQLHTYGLSLAQDSVFPIEPPDVSTLAVATRSLPELRDLILQPQLGELLRNLKILDWVAATVEVRLGTGEAWTGLSDIIESLWSRWIQSDSQRYVRDDVLKKIGIEETESFSGAVSLDNMATAERQVLADLEGSRLLDVRGGRVSFTHNLLGDWSRLHTLIGIGEFRIPSEFRSRAENPRWHAAIRLYGLRILERARDGSTWFQLIQQLDDGSDAGRLASDLVLEAVAFAGNAGRFLELAWPHLSGDDGALLRRLLRRFRHLATFPEPMAAAVTPDQDIGIWLAASMRIPVWPLWGPMLEFLHAHADGVKGLALAPAAELCQMWLSTMPAKTGGGKPFPWRRQAAELALTLAREMQVLQAENAISSGKGCEQVYEAFLQAAHDLPEEVSALALEFAKRRPPGPETQEKVERARQKAAEQKKSFLEDPKHRADLVPTIPLTRVRRSQEAWPAGPTERVDEAFRRVCLSKDALRPMMRERPEVAREVILALCIEFPRQERYLDGLIAQVSYGTAWTAERTMFFSGPFLLFLQVNPEVAIELVVELVDFATDRWHEWVRARNGVSAESQASEGQSVAIWTSDGRHGLLGDSQVFGWYRDGLSHAPYVASALMALEKWLYDRVEAGQDISQWIGLLLPSARSVAFLGVLTALGKKYPKLLAGCLRPILGTWQVYQWDLAITQADAVGFSGMSLTLWVRRGEGIFNVVRDWHVLPHRKLLFRDVVVQMLLTHPDLRQHFEEVREQWRDQLQSPGAASHSLEFLVERLDPANYRLYEQDGQVTATLEWPEHLRKDSETSLKASSYSLGLLDFPRKCRELIDQGRQLEPEELLQFWRVLVYLVDEHEEQGAPIEYLNSAVMGGIAVLSVLHEEWLEADRERVEWCTRQIERIVAAGDTQEASDPPHSVYNLRWQMFLGEIAIHSLAKDPDDADKRLHAAQAVLAYHYNTTEMVCKTAYRLREALGEEFGRLINLARLWAGTRHALEWCRSQRVQTPGPMAWYDTVQRSFVDHSLPAAPIPLREIASRSEALIMEAIRAHVSEASGGATDFSEQWLSGYLSSEEMPRRNQWGLDLEVIEAAFGWLPPLSEASNEQERATWIAIHEELLQLELIYIGTAPRNGWDEVDGAPLEFEYWILGLVAGLISQLRADERPERFWQPIMDLGANAHYWVESFLSSWLMSGGRAASEPAVFVEHWGVIIEYALASPLWRREPYTPGRFRLEGLYLELMGLGLSGAVVEQDAYADPLASLLPLYKKWAAEWLEHARILQAFASFLVKPAARELMLPGLVWVARAVVGISERDWDENRLPDSLLLLLVTCWRRHLPELEGDSETRKAFLDLLRALVARGNPGALELRDAILR